jgi:hypothetical protein
MSLRFNAFYSAVSASACLSVMSAGIVFGQASQLPAPTAPQAQQANGNPYSGYGSGYPAPEVEAVPMAYARSVNSRAEQDQMLSELHSTVDRLREDFNYSPEMVSATREQDSAFLAYDDARRKVLESLSSDPNYRALISLVVSLKQKLEDERPGPKPSPEDLERVLATATLKLSYASAASAMEVAALAADDDVMQTHARLILAGNKVGQMRQDFDREIRRSPEFLAARRNLDEARIARLTADAFLSGAVDAREVAMDYAYYLHRFDQYSYTPVGYGYPSDPYGYGYGLGNSGGYGTR